LKEPNREKVQRPQKKRRCNGTAGWPRPRHHQEGPTLKESYLRKNHPADPEGRTSKGGGCQGRGEGNSPGKDSSRQKKKNVARSWRRFYLQGGPAPCLKTILWEESLPSANKREVTTSIRQGSPRSGLALGEKEKPTTT